MKFLFFITFSKQWFYLFYDKGTENSLGIFIRFYKKTGGIDD